MGGVHTVGDLHHHEHDPTVATLAIAAGLGGLALGWLVFGVLAASVSTLKRPLAGLERACAAKFFFDELWREVLLRPSYALARAAAGFDAGGVDGLVNAVGRGGRGASVAAGRHDALVVDGAVNGVGAAAYAGGGRVSALQNGRVRFYLSLAVGILAAVLIVWRLA